MAGISSLRNLFVRKRKPVVIDLSDGEPCGPDTPTALPSDNGAPSANALVEAKPAARKPTLGEVQRSYDEVMDLVRRIGDHLDSQARRTEKLVELLDELPAALSSVPEMSRQNARMIEILGEHLGHTKRRDETLNTTLATIGQSARQHTEVLGLIQQQLDASSVSATKLGGTLEHVRGTLQEMSNSNSQTSRVLSQIADEGQMRDNKLIALVGSTQRWILVALVCSVVASLGAIGVVLFAILNG